MRQSFASRATYWLKVVSLGLVLGTGLQFASAWTPPTAAPPEGNVAGPVTTGSVDQTKNAKLTTLGLDVVKNMNSLRLIAPTPLQYSGIEFYTDIANNPTYTGGIRSHSNRGGRPELELWSGAGANIGNVHITGAGGTSSNLYVDGNVGIGTTAPTKKLDVSGGVKADEFCIGASCINSWPSGGGVADNLGNHTATQNLAMGGFNVSNAADVYANRFFDNNNAGYYVDPNGASILNTLGIVGKATSAATAATDSETTLTTKGYVDGKISSVGGGVVAGCIAQPSAFGGCVAVSPGCFGGATYPVGIWGSPNGTGTCPAGTTKQDLPAISFSNSCTDSSSSMQAFFCTR